MNYSYMYGIAEARSDCGIGLGGERDERRAPKPLSIMAVAGALFWFQHRNLKLVGLL